MRMYKLDKVIAEGTKYETGHDEFLVIKKIGTDSTNGANIVIDGKILGKYVSTLAPMLQDSSNGFPLIDLSDLYYVVPPDTRYWVQGGGSDRMRITGFIGKLDYNEKVPGEYMNRFSAQDKEFYTYVEGTLTLGTDVAFGAGAEQEVYALTPNTVEQYVFDNRLYCAVSGVSAGIDWDTFALRFYKQGEPLDVLTDGAAPYGIDLKAIPSPPTTTTQPEPFTLADYPVPVEGDKTLSVKVVNISGSNQAPDSGSAWSFAFKAVVRYSRK